MIVSISTFPVSMAFAGSLYIGTQSTLAYGPFRYATFSGNQTLSTDDGTGYITAGRLAFGQTLYFASSKTAAMSLAGLMQLKLGSPTEHRLALLEM